MFDVISPCERGTKSDASPLLQRSRGEAHCAIKVRSGRSVLGELRQAGCLKIRFPRNGTGGSAEAVLLNTAGGLTDGDALTFRGSAGADADAVFTTQASERVYRARVGRARVRTKLSIGPGARLAWLPQETILFDGARLARRFDVDMEADSRLLAHESVVFGRAAMGEAVETGLLNDQWRVRLGGKLVHAEAVHIEGEIAARLARPGLLSGARAMATVLLVAGDAEARLGRVRSIVDGLPPESGTAAVSAWNGKLVMRAVADGGAQLRTLVLPILRELQDGRGLPRVWMI